MPQTSRPWLIRMNWPRQYWSPIIAVVCILCGIGLVFYPTDTVRKNLTDLGPAIGGCWALAAGLLAYFAAVSGIRMQQEQRAREVAAVCIAEIQAVWAHIADMDVIENLRNSTVKLREDDSLNASVYRGAVGGSWLSLQSSNPEAFGILPHELAQSTTDHYSRLRNVIGRLNWMNSQKFEKNRYHEVFGRQNATETELRKLKDESSKLISKLQSIAA